MKENEELEEVKVMEEENNLCKAILGLILSVFGLLLILWVTFNYRNSALTLVCFMDLQLVSGFLDGFLYWDESDNLKRTVALILGIIALAVYIFYVQNMIAIYFGIKMLIVITFLMAISVMILEQIVYEHKPELSKYTIAITILYFLLVLFCL